VAVDRTEDLLRRRGVGRSSRVVLSAGNSLDFVAIVLAVARLGGATILVSTSWREREVAHALDVSAPTHLVHDGALDAPASALPTITLEEIRSAPAAEHHPAEDVDLDDLAPARPVCRRRCSTPTARSGTRCGTGHPHWD
jgi:acyl-CoA synthetase (AMP-forming)/AMP-acid ligase II